MGLSSAPLDALLLAAKFVWHVGRHHLDPMTGTVALDLTINHVEVRPKSCRPKERKIRRRARQRARPKSSPKSHSKLSLVNLNRVESPYA